MARCSEGEGLRAAVVVEAEGGSGGAAGEAGLILLDVVLAGTALGSASKPTPPSWSASCAMPVRVQGVEGCVEGLGGLRHGEADDGGQARERAVQKRQAEMEAGLPRTSTSSVCPSSLAL